MGITSFMRWKIASSSSCDRDGHHRKDDFAAAFSFDRGLGFVHVGREPVAKPFFL
jgi:hypothetical protein